MWGETPLQVAMLSQVAGVNLVQKNIVGFCNPALLWQHVQEKASMVLVKAHVDILATVA